MHHREVSKSTNLFIIINDGIRWQEIFNGADVDLINDLRVTPDAVTIKKLFWSDEKEERRKKLLPFFWNVIAEKGFLLGDRKAGSKVNAANIYSLSYPGYSEIFTGKADIRISGNKRKHNRNINVLEFLNCKEDLKGRIAIFSSWNGLPYILNEKRSGLFIDYGPEKEQEAAVTTVGLNMLQRLHEKGLRDKSNTRHDTLTFASAKQYILDHQPRVAAIILGEADVFAHEKRYDLYLQQANRVDGMIAELWNLVQTTPTYKGKTNFLITTDHGRGNNKRNWHDHGILIKGSSQTWVALLGPDIKPHEKVINKRQVYNKQFAEIIANLIGEKFSQ